MTPTGTATGRDTRTSGAATPGGAGSPGRRGVSIVVPVHNNPAGTDVLLEALARQTGPLPALEVIVVDNASVPPLDINAPDGLEVQVVREPRPGRSVARNAGIRTARGEVFAFIDSDCVPASDWLQRGLAALDAHPEAGFVAGRVDITVPDPDRPTAVERYEQVFAFNMQRNVERFHYGGTGNLFTTRGVVDAVGLFDESLESSEDLEWGQRVHQAGYGLVYADDAVVTHDARRTFSELARKLRRTTGGGVQLERRSRASMSVPRRAADASARMTRAFLEAVLLPPYRFVGLVRRRAAGGVGWSVRLLFLMYGIHGVRFLERVRLALGGRPRR